MGFVEYPRQPLRRAGATVPLVIIATATVIVLGSVLATLLVQRGASTGHATVASVATHVATTPPRATVSTSTPQPPKNIPPPTLSAPPPAHTFNSQLNAAYTALNCSTLQVPQVVVDPTSGLVNEPTPVVTATPTAPAVPTPTTTPTKTPTATPTVANPTATPAPSCGNGQQYGPNCSTQLPGPTPTYDQERQALFNASVKYGMSFSLIEAIAWQESGWQQNVVACDGGIGTMQLMPDTAKWLNQYYHTSYDPYVLADNTNLGVGLLRYLYLYYLPFCNQGLPAGQACTGDTVWPGATDGATLRDIIVSAYNEGSGTMANYGIINWWYVNSVISLRNQFLATQ